MACKWIQIQIHSIFIYILEDHTICIFGYAHQTWGARGGVVFKALRYKPAGRGFDSR